jgi:ferredoxin-NADP reductase
MIFSQSQNDRARRTPQMATPRGFQRATVTRIVPETADTRTYVLAPHGEPFVYRAGQFCTFRVRVDGRDLLRSYSMSSAPETDAELMTTVKRVPGGAVSNWLHDNLAEGDVVELTRPAGLFCLRPAAVPLLGFAGGSGITPILSLTKSALAGTDRPVRLLCADRDRAAAIFGPVLAGLLARYPGRLTVVRHYDDQRGLLDAAAVRDFVGAQADADAYICGPDPFMRLIESALPGPGRVFSERFGDPPPAPAAPASPAGPAQLAVPAATADPAATAAVPDLAATADPAATAAVPDLAAGGTVTIVLRKKRISVARRPGETLLESARRGGLAPPFSCESGTCATCMAKLVSGRVTMRVNEVLTDDEVADGYVLTCQGVPASPSVSVRYED